MKTRFVVLINPATRAAEIQELYRHVGRPDTVVKKGKFCEFVFDNEVDLVAFNVEAAGVGVTDPLVRKGHIYTRSEILESPLLRVLVKTSEKGYGGPCYGTKYDLSRPCPRCGSGAIQTSPLVLSGPTRPQGETSFRRWTTST